MHDCIRGEIGQLPRASRDVLILGELGGLNDEEVAQALGISLANAKVRLHRARAHLKTAIAARCEFYRTELSCAPNSPGCCPPRRRPKSPRQNIKRILRMILSENRFPLFGIIALVTFFDRAPSKGSSGWQWPRRTGARPMKKRFCAPYAMLALALVGTSIAFYDAYCAL